MNREDALKKIKKCLAVARGNSPEEAAVALGQAQKLMAAFGVNERDVSLADVIEVKVKACSTAANLWEVRLCGMVAEAFGCEHFAELVGFYNPAGNFVRQRQYVFVGLIQAPTVAAYAYEVLSRQCARDRLAHIRKQPKNCKPITKSARGDEFARGWVFAVQGLVERFSQPEKDAQLLLDYMAEKHPDMKSEKARHSAKGRRTTLGHQMAGFDAGSRAQLNRGVGAFAPKGLLACR